MAVYKTGLEHCAARSLCRDRARGVRGGPQAEEAGFWGLGQWIFCTQPGGGTRQLLYPKTER